jgi:hypothetical protein
MRRGARELMAAKREALVGPAQRQTGCFGSFDAGSRARSASMMQTYDQVIEGSTPIASCDLTKRILLVFEECSISYNSNF